MSWKIDYEPKAKKDVLSLDNSKRAQVVKAVERVAQNPLPRNEGGYGEPLGNKDGQNLTGLYKIKLKKAGIRVVYKLVRVGGVMKIVVVAARADGEVYDLAAKRERDN